MNDPNTTAKVICDSINIHGNRLTTMLVTFPRFILSEMGKHRMLSMSTASSRAIPLKKQIEKVKSNPFIPPYVGKNQSGMQASGEIDEEDLIKFKREWLQLADEACRTAYEFDKLGVHKQTASRILEPWLYTTMIISGTEWANFFSLRCSPLAQPEFQILAWKMLEAYVESKPALIQDGWHIPFGDKMPHGLTEEQRILIAIGRCARTSYETHDGDHDPEKDIKLTNKLLADKHLVPAEHVAKPNNHSNVFVGNFKGWIQFRKKIMVENVVTMDYAKLLRNKPHGIM